MKADIDLYFVNSYFKNNSLSIYQIKYGMLRILNTPYTLFQPQFTFCSYNKLASMIIFAGLVVIFFHIFFAQKAKPTNPQIKYVVKFHDKQKGK